MYLHRLGDPGLATEGGRGDPETERAPGRHRGTAGEAAAGCATYAR